MILNINVDLITYNLHTHQANNNNRIHGNTLSTSNAPFTFGLRWVYGARILPVSPFPCGLCAEAGGGREIFVQIHGRRGLYDFV